MEEENKLQRLFAVFSLVIQHSSSFYREKYKRDGIELSNIASPKDIQHLPFLTRPELVASPIWERAYFPEEDITMAGVTSGTTSNEPLILFRNNFITEPPEIDAKRLLIITLQPWRLVSQVEWFRQSKIFLVCGDYHNSTASIALAAKVGIDAFYSTPTIMQLLAPQFQKLYDVRNIKLLLLTAERVSEITRNTLHSLYPNAMLMNHYAFSEIGSISLSCPSSSDLLLFHCDKNILYEVIDEQGQPVIDVPGELVLSTLVQMPTPFIRYRTGDEAIIFSTPCACGKEVFKIQGRVHFDTIKIGGFELRSTSFEKGIVGLEHLVDGCGYQVHVYEEIVQGITKPLLVFHIPLLGSLTAGQQQEIIDHISIYTMVGRHSLKDAQKKNTLLVKFEFLDASREINSKKHMRLVRHSEAFTEEVL